ncbi:MULTISPECIES: hypothetical protein [Pseudomonas]|nr:MULTISPECIES: hypothetical protein [Pseudomonas]MBH3432280.1 hypothetical protein [Pseudomonas citronellolis]
MHPFSMLSSQVPEAVDAPEAADDEDMELRQLVEERRDEPSREISLDEL